ncbi:efflux RND transporter periplasmic adaptor subunit [Parabacteroides sp. Marseille-P3160]|uniref:efflux RND transporter periplasmic adaptor subunit n=1 Tax=Parabacteroides sp. Marseille-P3160 TaxID=1917887 RepID=UPI0009BC48E6|nr:efflux RND transporter periplasmic adaptor subunit [Parabacteroides sp. Marseille-P3160]
MKHKLLLMFPLLFACACHSPKEEDGGSSAMTLRGDTLQIGEKSPVLGKLKTEKISTEPYRMEFSTSGVVRAIPTGYAEIAPPFAGRITRTFIRLGQKVSEGSPLFEISSPSFFETGKSYYQAKQELELALKNLNRERDLFKNKVGVQKELEEAEADYELKKKELENWIASLKVYQIDPQKLIVGQPLVVRSPISGEIVLDRIVIGQYFKEDAEPVAVVANLNKVWFVANIKEKDLHLLRSSEEVEIRLVALPDRPIKGKIYHISELLDEETRSVELLIECDNRERLMKPSMYGTVRLSDHETEVIRVPASALLQEEAGSYVWVSLGKNSFRKQPVSAGETKEGKTVILSGLVPGEELVTTGAFYLLDAQ